MINFDLRQLQQFLTIAEAGSFRLAADRLHIAQPALSVSIRKLEEVLTVRLFTRCVRGVVLTEAGRAFLPQAHRSLKNAEQARDQARLAASGEVGTLRIGFIGSAVYRLLPAMLPEFVKRHPAIRLELFEGTTVGIIPKILSGELDAGIVRTPISVDANLEVTNLEADELVAMLPSGHPFAGYDRLSLGDLRDDAFVMFSQKDVPELHAAVLSACAQAGFVPRIAQEVTQATTMVGLVGSRIGVALSPSVIAQIANDKVRFVPIERPRPVRLMMSLATLSGHGSPSLHLFGTALKAVSVLTPAAR